MSIKQPCSDPLRWLQRMAWQDAPSFLPIIAPRRRCPRFSW